MTAPVIWVRVKLERATITQGLKHTLNYRRQIREARCLDHDAGDCSTARYQIIDGARQISPHGAADAAVVQFKNVFLNIDYELAIGADFTKLIDDNGSLFRTSPDLHVAELA
jgi:hypothetical protein